MNHCLNTGNSDWRSNSEEGKETQTSTSSTCSMMKCQYAIRIHVWSMRLADTLKVLLKIISLTETIISTAASQSKNDITEVSVNILNRNNCSNFLHRCQVVNTSNASFNQMHSHRWTDDTIRWSAFGRAIVVSSILAVDSGAFMVAQYFICMTINACIEKAELKDFL